MEQAGGVAQKLWDGVTRLLFGRDVFISYSHRDGDRYARSLSAALEGHRRKGRLTCYFDQRAAILDSELPAEVLRSLRWSSMLVVVGTPGAASSSSVRTEIAVFQRARRPIVLLVCQPGPDAALDQFVADLRARSVVVVVEARGAVEDGPSPAAMERIRDSADFVRQDRRVGFAGGAAVSFLAMLAAFTIWRTKHDQQTIQATRLSALIPGIVVQERTTTLDLADWQPTTPGEVEARLKKSKAVSTNHFTIRRTKADAQTFVHIMGTSSGIMPTVHNLSDLKMWVEARQSDETTRAPHEWNIEFDISQVAVGKRINVDFSVDFWNAFQRPDQWWGGFRILHQTGKSTYTIKFPSRRHPRPETITYAIKEDTATEKKFDEETPDTTIDLDNANRVKAVTWRKLSPLGDTSYRIKWNWNDEPPTVKR